MIASGIVPSATAGRMRWRIASANTFHCADSRPLSEYMFDTKSTTARNGPWSFSMPQRIASGTISSPEVSRPDGGSEKGVPLRTSANSDASNRPSTKTGIDTPRLAPAIVRTSIAEFRL